MNAPALRHVLLAIALSGCSDTIVEPSAPVGRPEGLRAELVSSNSVRLTWERVTTGIAPLTYTVYRDEARLDDVSTAEFVDTGVPGNGAHVWYVVARAGNGDVSAPSNPVSIVLGDIDAPKVIASTPAGSASGVSRLPNPTITFSEPMIPASIDMKAVVVSLTTTGNRVYGTVRYDVESRTADFSPLAILPARTSVTVTVTPGAKDVAGNSLTTPFSFTFDTGDDPTGTTQPAPSAEPLIFGHRGMAFRYDVFRSNLDGSRLTNLTSHPAIDRDASWSPDGRHVAFASDRDGTYDIYVMRDDGTALQQLTFGDRDQTAPRWSSDGTRIVFSSSREGVPPAPNFNTPFDIWAMNADGSGQENLTRTPTLYEWWPHWSPDGKKLLFTRAEVLLDGSGTWIGTRTRIMIAEANASGATPLHAPDTLFVDDVASWSPDGSRIAFSVQYWDIDPFGETWLIYSVRPDGSDMKQITTAGSRRNPSWSPDGSELLVSRSGFNEFWGRFGEIAVTRLNLTTLATTTVIPHRPAGAEVMSPQSWRR